MKNCSGSLICINFLEDGNALNAQENIELLKVNALQMQETVEIFEISAEKTSFCHIDLSKWVVRKHGVSVDECGESAFSVQKHAEPLPKSPPSIMAQELCSEVWLQQKILRELISDYKNFELFRNNFGAKGNCFFPSTSHDSHLQMHRGRHLKHVLGVEAFHLKMMSWNSQHEPLPNSLSRALQWILVVPLILQNLWGHLVKNSVSNHGVWFCLLAPTTLRHLLYKLLCSGGVQVNSGLI